MSRLIVGLADLVFKRSLFNLTTYKCSVLFSQYRYVVSFTRYASLVALTNARPGTRRTRQHRGTELSVERSGSKVWRELQGSSFLYGNQTTPTTERLNHVYQVQYSILHRSRDLQTSIVCIFCRQLPASALIEPVPSSPWRLDKTPD